MADVQKTPEKKQEKKLVVCPVYGSMVHVLTGVVYDGATEVKEVDSWLQSQIDSGKMTLG